MVYEGSRCTYCGRCADVCPEKAISLSQNFQTATDNKEDITERVELFMLTCQRCGRCYDMEHTNAIDRLDLRGYRYDNLEARALIPKTSDHFDQALFDATANYKRPTKI